MTRTFLLMIVLSSFAAPAARARPSDASATPAVPPIGGEVAPINAVVGDASWVEAFGRLPTEDDAVSRDEDRHRVHLAWIEARLRRRHVRHLSPALRATRERLLDALADYQKRGVHPVNPREERLPRWLDGEGRVCAVGYLMEITAGRDFVEAVNARHEHAYLLDIHDPALDAWIATTGFTKVELASIQPTGYSGIGGLSLGEPEAWLAAFGGIVLGGLNVATVAIDLQSLRRPSLVNERFAETQIAWGVLQLVATGLTFGFASQPDFDDDYDAPLLIGAAAATVFATFEIVFGAVSLAVREESPDERRARERERELW